MTTLQFLLPSSPACPPLACGEGNRAVIPLKQAAAGKSADGSGYLLGTIVEALALSQVQWRYSIEIADAEIATGQNVSADDVTGQVACVSGADSALLAKIALLAPAAIQPLNWQTFVLFPALKPVLTVTDAYLLRRQTGFRLHAIEAAIAGGQGPITITLQKTAPNGVAYAPILMPLTISGSGVFTARHAPAVPYAVGGLEALRASISGADTSYDATAFGLELHLITSEL